MGKSKRTSEGQYVPLPYAQLKSDAWRSLSGNTVQRAYGELVAKGFLVLEHEGNWYNRRAHEWRLTTKPMHRPKGRELPTNDWRQFKHKTVKVA